MFLLFHKLTTELFNSIKTQQINVFNASVDSNANCLCHTLGVIKSTGLQAEQRIVCSRSVIPLTETTCEVEDIVCVRVFVF